MKKKKKILPPGTQVESATLKIGQRAIVILPNCDMIRTSCVQNLTQKRRYLAIETERSIYILKGADWLTDEAQAEEDEVGIFSQVSETNAEAESEQCRPLFLIAGPSGCGKTTLVENLKRFYGLKPVVSYTTRPMREGEKDGKDHFFIDQKAFNRLEGIKAITTFNGYQYCVTGDILEQCDTYVIDPEGIESLKGSSSSDLRPLIVIGILATAAVCKERMLKRGDSEEKAEERLKHDKKAFKKLPDLSTVMLDGTLSETGLMEQAWAVMQTYL